MNQRLLITVVVLSIIMSLTYYTLFAPQYLRTYHSPDGQYRLDVYARQKWFSMPGDGSTKCAKLKLYKGFWQVWNDCPRCPAFTNDMYIEWDMENKRVWFARARTIDLETGRCEQ